MADTSDRSEPKMAAGTLGFSSMPPPLLEDNDGETLHDVDEQPIRPGLRVADGRDLGALMGAPPASMIEVLLCRNAILRSLHEAMSVGRPEVHYSRDRNTYSAHRGALPSYWTYRNVMRAVAELTGACVLIERRAVPQSPRSRAYVPERSRLSAGPAFAGNSIGSTVACSA